MSLPDISKNPCPCHSSVVYAECCQPYHEGKLAENALKLMRSRFAAYALNLPKYIIRTTHPASPQYGFDPRRWEQQLSHFSLNTTFDQLEILDFKEFGLLAVVTFFATLTQKGRNIAYTELSYFEKIDGHWLYRNGRSEEGRDPNLIQTEPMRVLPLAYYGAPVLRTKCNPVAEITDDIRQLVQDMKETMIAHHGMGLAAPQVHQSIRLFITHVPPEDNEDENAPTETKVFINPELSSPSIDKFKASEGCLSIPTIRADVERPAEITIEYTDLDGQRKTERFSGWQAKAVMHENDHINGVLFFDRIPKDERAKLTPFLTRLEERIKSSGE